MEAKSADGSGESDSKTLSLRATFLSQNGYGAKTILRGISNLSMSSLPGWGGYRNQNRNGVIVIVVVIMVDRDRDPPPDRGRGHDRVPPQSWGAVGDHD